MRVLHTLMDGADHKGQQRHAIHILENIFIFSLSINLKSGFFISFVSFMVHSLIKGE